MQFIAPVALFAFLMAAISYAGYRYYARPGRFYEQIGTAAPSAGLGVEGLGSQRPEGVVVTLVKKLGEKVPISPEEATYTRRYLYAAGYRSDSAVAVYYGIRVIVFVAFLAAAWVGWSYVPLVPTLRIVILLLGAVLGYFVPTMVLDWLVGRRQEILQYALPDALDLMVVCVEAGLGIDQAIVNVAKELMSTHPELCEELELISLEMQAGKSRQEALRNLGQRTGEDEIKKLVAVLIQTDRFGTSMADSLRTHSEFMRIRRRQKAEERANKVGVKLVFPIFFCILPAMLLVVAGPGLLQIMKELFPMMREFRQNAS